MRVAELLVPHVPEDPAAVLLDELDRGPNLTPERLRKLKFQVARRTQSTPLANDLLFHRYREEVQVGKRPRNPGIERLLTLNPIRSASGINTVTVLVKPYLCPGKCVYCPTEARMPKSYLANEPAAMRAARQRFDPYLQMADRLKALENTGHAADKIEVIIKGGTWSSYPEDYQRWFVRRLFEAANSVAFAQVPGSESSEPGTFGNGTELVQAQRENEASRHRIVGLTVETRPDWVTQKEIVRLREWGVTRVELGVQSLEESVLQLTQRGHTTAEVRQATRLLRDAGFKVAYHLMPNLPGATPEDDIRTFQTLFEDPDYRPDALKIYPCVVVESAQLYSWWREGRYQPYDEETLTELLIDLKERIPPTVRIERVIRDIPAPSIAAGSKSSNLREEVLRRMKRRGLRCRCIRCREIKEKSDGNFQLVRRDYEASGGMEIFLSFEDAKADRLAALLRLRIPSQIFSGTGRRCEGEKHQGSADPFPVLDNAALIRELHTYGRQLPLGGHSSFAFQHRGFGRQLVAEAERIARGEFGLPRMAVISGVGVREYYRRLGYHLSSSYMVKSL